MAEQAHGIVLKYTVSGGSEVTVGEITDITPPAITKDVIETTNHSSGVKSYLGGLVDFGECSITVNYDPDGTAHTGVRDLAKTANDDGDTQFVIEYSDAGSSTETFNGIVTGFTQETPIDDKLSATFTIKVTQSNTYA